MARIAFFIISKKISFVFLRSENHSVNLTIKSINVLESQTNKKATNPSKPIVNAPVKPIPNKKTLSPMDDQ